MGGPGHPVCLSGIYPDSPDVCMADFGYVRKRNLLDEGLEIT